MCLIRLFTVTLVHVTAEEETDNSGVVVGAVVAVCVLVVVGGVTFGAVRKRKQTPSGGASGTNAKPSASAASTATNASTASDAEGLEDNTSPP